MHIAVVGTGYVGLVTGACLADTGNDVVCCDLDQDKIARLNRGEIPIYEPGLEPLVERNLAEGRLRFTTDVAAAAAAAEVVFIAVGAPPGEDGSADLQHVLAVAETIGRSMPGDGPEKIVITKSTVPVGTAAKVREAIGKHTTRVFHVCSDPEFLKEGAAVQDFMKPDRVVVGVDSEHARERLAELYAPYVRSGNPVDRLAEGRLLLCEHNYDCLEGADALLVLTEWSAYRTPDFGRIRAALAQSVVFDGRNLWEPARMRELGFRYTSVTITRVTPPAAQAL